MKLVKLFMLTAFCCAVSLFSVGIAAALDEWVHIDIEPYSNTKLVEHQWWTLNPGDSTLSLLPIGEVGEFEGARRKGRISDY